MCFSYILPMEIQWIPLARKTKKLTDFYILSVDAFRTSTQPMSKAKQTPELLHFVDEHLFI